MENVTVQKIEERALWRLIDEASEQYLQEKGYIKDNGGKKRTAIVDSLLGGGDDSTLVSSSEDGADLSTSFAAEGSNDSLAVFREEAFLPCFMSEAEARALHFLADAFSGAAGATGTATLISTAYAEKYGTPLPADVEAGIADYVKQKQASNWHSHALSFMNLYTASEWGEEAKAHERVWTKALNSDSAAQWSTFFHALHSLRALGTSKTAERFVRHFSAGGFTNRFAVAELQSSLETERTSNVEPEKLLAAATAILGQASRKVEEVDADDLAALCAV